MNIKISIIMPSLNVGRFIEECIQSVISSTLEDIEIICVDAGSTDRTTDIIKQYEKKDPRIRLIEVDNKSYGYQVNVGINNALGEYIGIVETDDLILPYTYECLYNLAQKNGYPDIVKGDYEIFMYDPAINEIIIRKMATFDTRRKAYYRKIINSKKHPELLLWDTYIWKGIYKKEFLDSKGIRLNESKGAAFQDNGFLFQTIGLADSIYYTDDVVYRYRRDNENASVFSNRGYWYVNEEYGFIRRLIERGCESLAHLKPFYVLRLFSMIRFRNDVSLYAHLPAEHIKEGLKINIDLLKLCEQNGWINYGLFSAEERFELGLYLKDIDLYADYITEKHKLKAGQFDKLLEKLRQRKNIYLYGTGNIGSMAYYNLLRNNFQNISGWCDSNKELWNKQYMGIRIVPLDEVFKNYKAGEMTFVITSPYNAIDMNGTLLENNISADDIFFYINNGYFGL